MKKQALYVLIASVAISALLGIVALFAGDFGDLEVKSIFTSLTVAGASIIILACGAAAEKGRAATLVPLGIGSALAAGVLMLMGIWSESRLEELWKSAGMCVVVAAFAGHAALLLAANILRHREWVRAATLGCTGVLSVLLIGMIWIERFDRLISWRWLAAAAILGSAGTITTLVFARIDREAYARNNDDGITSSSVPVCPHCGGVLPESMKQIFS